MQYLTYLHTKLVHFANLHSLLAHMPQTCENSKGRDPDPTAFPRCEVLLQAGTHLHSRHCLLGENHSAQQTPASQSTVLQHPRADCSWRHLHLTGLARGGR